jgi:hypothetical protein
MHAQRRLGEFWRDRRKKRRAPDLDVTETSKDSHDVHSRFSVKDAGTDGLCFIIVAVCALSWSAGRWLFRGPSTERG